MTFKSKKSFWNAVLPVNSPEDIYSVQNKSSSDMQVSHTELCVLLQVQLLACVQILILFYSSLWFRMYRPFNDFMQEEAEGQPATSISHTRTQDKKHSNTTQITLA